GQVDHAVKVGVDLRAEIVVLELLEGYGMAEARVIDQHIEPPEPVQRSLYRGPRGQRIGDVEREWVSPIAEAFDQVGQLAGVARGGDNAVARGQGRLDDLAAEA